MNINLDKEMKLFIEAACKVGQNPIDTGCTPAGAPKFKIPKFKMPKIKLDPVDPEKLKKAEKEAERERAYLDKKYKDKKRKQNIVDGVDVIQDDEDLQHYWYEMRYQANTVEDMDEYNKRMDEQYQEQMSKLSKEEQQQVKEDAASWKKLGGYEAIQEAIESGETSEQEIRDRNERMSERAHETITKVEQPIERGLTIPTSDVDEFLERFVEGEDAEIPDEGGHGSSGFSIDAQKARFFGKLENEDETKTSIIIRLLPNSKGEVRGLFIDGEPGTEFEEGEIIRSSKSKAKVVSVEKVKYPNGKMVITITLQEPDDLSEVVFKEAKEEKEVLIDNASD